MLTSSASSRTKFMYSSKPWKMPNKAIKKLIIKIINKIICQCTEKSSSFLSANWIYQIWVIPIINHYICIHLRHVISFMHSHILLHCTETDSLLIHFTQTLYIFKALIASSNMINFPESSNQPVNTLSQELYNSHYRIN